MGGCPLCLDAIRDVLRGTISLMEPQSSTDSWELAVAPFAALDEAVHDERVDEV